MKDIFTEVDGNPCILTVSDYTDQRIMVNGREWRFDFSKMFGPLWLRKDGEPRVCQYPKKEVWDEFTKWQHEHGLGPKK